MSMNNEKISVGPCQYCMSGGSFSIPNEKAQLVLYDNVWQPWPLVTPIPDNAPMLLCDVCPVCDRERFNAEEVPRLNAKIDAWKKEVTCP